MPTVAVASENPAYDYVVDPQGFGVTGATGANLRIPIGTLSPKRAYIRIQKDVPNKLIHVQGWDGAGNLIFSASNTFTATTTITSTGLQVGNNQPSTNNPMSVGFLRVYSTVVSTSAKQPVHAATGDLADYKFEGNLNDTSGNGYNLTADGAGAPFTYDATPGQTPISMPRTYEAPSWNAWTSMRAGFTNTLDGTNSVSQNDSSDALTYFWQQLSGPSTLRWSSRTASQPVVTGVVFGSYEIKLKVTDAGGLTHTATITVGAVSHDSNGVVIHADPVADKLFGPTIAFGKNPWTYMDMVHLRSMRNRAAYKAGLKKTWDAGPGTVNADANSRYTTLSGAITASDRSITVADATQFTTTTYPIILRVNSEYIAVCSIAGNTLTVCYDGRGYARSTAASAGSGVRAYQDGMWGTGTNFVSQWCPAGAGTIAGSLQYNTGTVSVTAGSTTVTGSGTNWSGGIPLYLNGRAIVIAGTYSGGTPFKFFATITINSTTSLTLSKAFPADADTASGLTYWIIRPDENMYATYEWTRSDSSIGHQIRYVQSCLSDTYVSFSLAGLEHANGRFANRKWDNVPYWWSTNSGNGDPNFYDEVLADYALYYRSGLTEARDAARSIGDTFPLNPAIDEGWGYMEHTARNVGLAGMMASTLLDGRDHWYYLRRYWDKGASSRSSSCNAGDTRDQAYVLQWLGQGALFETDAGRKATYIGYLADRLTRDQGCKRDDNSFSTSFYWNTSRPVTMTNGSTTVTTSGASSAWCNVEATGEGTATNGSQTLVSTTGNFPTFPVGVYVRNICVQGTIDGVADKMRCGEYASSGTSTVKISFQWPGATGAVKWWAQTAGDVTIITAGNSDTSTLMNEVYACSYVSPTELTLSKPWPRASGTYYMYSANVAGRGLQPFFGGLMTAGFDWVKQANVGTASGFQTLLNDHSAWLVNSGYNPAVKGFDYATNAANCNPRLVGDGTYSYVSTGCQWDTSSYGKGAGRSFNAEGFGGFRFHYEANPTVERKAQGDEAYGQIFGIPGYTTDGLNIYDTDLGENIYIGPTGVTSGKWYGFHYGISLTHQWPAVRVGGVAARANRTITFNFRIISAARPTVTKARITFTEPNGATTSVTCTESPCSVPNMDARQGRHLVNIERLTAGDAVVTRTSVPLWVNVE